MIISESLNLEELCLHQQSTLKFFASFLNISEILGIAVKLFHIQYFTLYEIYIEEKRNSIYTNYIYFMKYI